MSAFALRKMAVPAPAPPPKGQRPMTVTTSADSAQRYRDAWAWDRVAWVSHCVDCYPSNCPMRAYVQDGRVVREEPAGVFPVVEEGVPDMNPMGCQKGAAWSRMLEGEERLRYPLKRVGKRGEGRWQRVSWDEAATAIADGILDAVAEVGPESVVAPSGCNTAPVTGTARSRFLGAFGGLTTDVNAEMNDFAPGYYLTYGDLGPVSSVDDWFHAEVFIIWFGNPNYTRIPYVHFVNEARYHGCEVVTIAPDFSPSAVHADQYLPVRVGSDAALALGMAHVVVEEGLVNEAFVREQTDLPLLVDRATSRYLRESDMVEGGSEEQFYAWDEASGRPLPAPRGTLFWGEARPVLEGDFTVQTHAGERHVTTVFTLMRERLADYTPERAAAICGLHADAVRNLARMIARRRTSILGALGGAGKYYHGDLIERSQLLLMALTGNWGRKGTGVRVWLSGLFDGATTFGFKSRRGPEEVVGLLEARDAAYQAAAVADPSLTPLIAGIDGAKRAGAVMVPPILWWYHHAGFREVWNRSEWHDPSMKRPFDEYFQEAMARGWWAGVDYPRADQPTRVIIECGGNVLRRTRGANQLLEHVWPKLSLVVTLDVRMSTTALYSDYVLPCAGQYEKIGFCFSTTHTMNLTFSDKAAEPPGEAVHEWEAFRRLAEKLEERARARGLAPYTDARGVRRDPASAHAAFTRNGVFVDEEVIADEMMRDSALTGVLPEDASLASIRERGIMRWQGLGISPRSLAQATEPQPNETYAPYRDHVEKGAPYPTLTRRAQLYVDHEWFIEAGEQLPCHKEPPASGGDYPFQLTSGHNRWSVHSDNTAARMMLETHRGTPHLVVNSGDATRLGIADNDVVRVFNDQGEFRVAALVSPSPQPGQVVMYNGFDPYQFPGWSNPNDTEPGMVKWLHLAGGYGHLRYWATQWQPCPVMRGTRVGLARSEK
ncbi:MAG: molybdopterin-dependent oxidoreductase [Dehalococcoidia bacterium]|nr:molybdopterin-dependent oxidoreductase [Dehalococcoidia bacterium]